VVVSSSGKMIVIQQGMNPSKRMARRYHIDRMEVETPHSGIAGARDNIVLDATSRESRSARKLYLDIILEGPRRFETLLREANSLLHKYSAPRGLESYFSELSIGESVEKDVRGYYVPIRPTRNLMLAIKRLSQAPLAEESDLLIVPGLGPKVIRALALIVDLVYGVPTSDNDPVSHPLDPYLYAHAVGGKDGIPYPFDPKTALEAYQFLVRALEESHLGYDTKMKFLKRIRSNLRRRLGVSLE
jgi:hypothetical protein